MWKRRLEGQIRGIRKDLSRLERLPAGKPLKTKVRDGLQRKYWLKEKGITVVIEEIKQRITAKAKSKDTRTG